MQKADAGSDGRKADPKANGNLREEKQKAARSRPGSGTLSQATVGDGRHKVVLTGQAVTSKPPPAKSIGSSADAKTGTNGGKSNGRKSKGAKGVERPGVLATQGLGQIETPKGRARRLWGLGDYQAIAANLLIIAETLCETADLRAGQKVLDVATGTGNAALGAARRGCRTIGVDFAPSLLQRARRRAEAEGLTIKLVTGDAESLPFADNSFDVVLSTLGVMFAANQAAAAAELLRVTRPGGKIALANWTPDGGNAAVSEIVAKYLPAPHAPPFKQASPYKWGSAEGLTDLLGCGARLVQAERRSFKARDLSALDSWNAFQSRCGFVLHFMSTLEDQVRAQITKEVVAASEAMNCSGDDTLLVAQDYLEAIAIKAGG